MKWLWRLGTSYFFFSFVPFHYSTSQIQSLYPKNIVPTSPRVTHHPAFSVWELSWWPLQPSFHQQNVSLPGDCLQTPGLPDMAILPALQIQLQVQGTHSILKCQVVLLQFWGLNSSMCLWLFRTLSVWQIVQNDLLVKILKKVREIISYEVILWRHYWKGRKKKTYLFYLYPSLRMG